MYIEKVVIKNMRGIEHLEIDFTKQARPGWHVLLGENGSGKSTILRAISLALIGPYDIKAFRLNLQDWLHKASMEGYVSLTIFRDEKYDRYVTNSAPLKKPFEAKVVLKKLPPDDPRFSISQVIVDKNGSKYPEKYIWSNAAGWFAAGFGPFRRFTGGDKDWMELYSSVARGAAFLSIFGENVALAKSLEWLNNLHYQKLDDVKEAELQLNYFTKFINKTGLLPQGTYLADINSRGIFFEDGNGNQVEITQLSDGFRTILSMTFELMRQMIRTYGMEAVFSGWDDENHLKIELPGVVLIDEMDVHLHPTWQQDIGEWFLEHFPQVQFIVTTHSLFILRACHTGSIWQLAAPGSGESSRQITGQEKDRLVLGTLDDALSTGVMGDVSQSEEGQAMGERIAALSKKSFKGMLSKTENDELQTLRAKLPTAS